MIEETRLLKSFHLRKLIFIACRRLDGEENLPIWSEERIASVSPWSEYIIYISVGKMFAENVISVTR